MKNMNRAYNRHKQNVKFIRRVKNWLKDELTETNLKEALSGKTLLFLRTTGRPCNCYGCSGFYKYKRTQKQKVKKEIYENIE